MKSQIAGKRRSKKNSKSRKKSKKTVKKNSSRSATKQLHMRKRSRKMKGGGVFDLFKGKKQETATTPPLILTDQVLNQKVSSNNCNFEIHPKNLFDNYKPALKNVEIGRVKLNDARQKALKALEKLNKYIISFNNKNYEILKLSVSRVKDGEKEYIDTLVSFYKPGLICYKNEEYAILFGNYNNMDLPISNVSIKDIITACIKTHYIPFLLIDLNTNNALFLYYAGNFIYSGLTEADRYDSITFHQILIGIGKDLARLNLTEIKPTS